jgi:hypothetical protein
MWGVNVDDGRLVCSTQAARLYGLRRASRKLDSVQARAVF